MAMNRRYLNITILVIATVYGAIFVRYGHALSFTVCPFKAITGYPCVGCGGTRAAMLLSQGQILAALKLNPLSVLLILWIAVSYVLIFADVLRNRDTYWKIYKKKWPTAAVIATIVILLANWIWNISKGL